MQVWGWLPARPELPVPHSQEEIEIFADERDLRRRKLMIRCGFYARGECKFEGCCARSLRIAAAAKGSADSDYGSADSNDCADDGASDGSASDSGNNGEKWEIGRVGVRGCCASRKKSGRRIVAHPEGRRSGSASTTASCSRVVGGTRR